MFITEKQILLTHKVCECDFAVSRLSSLEEHKPKQVSHLTHQFSPFKSDITCIEPPENTHDPFSNLEPGSIQGWRTSPLRIPTNHYSNHSSLESGANHKLMVGQCGRVPRLSTPKPETDSIPPL